MIKEKMAVCDAQSGVSMGCRWLGSLYVVVALMLLVPDVVDAQTNSCNALLQHGIFDVSEILNAETEQRRVYNYVCDKERRKALNISATEAQAAYKVFSAGARRGKTTLEEYEAEVCSESESDLFKMTEYTRKARMINRNALAAWTSCIQAGANGILIDPDVSPSGKIVNFSLKNARGGQHSLTSIASDIFECNLGNERVDRGGLNGAPIPLRYENARGINVAINCNRMSGEPLRTDGVLETRYPSGGLTLNLTTETFTIWFAELIEGRAQRRLTALEQIISTLVPRDAVVAFELRECPAGWEEYERAYGRFIRGIDRSPINERIDPDGERIAGTLQDDNVGEHVHIYQGGGAGRAPTADNDCCDIRETWSGGDWRQQNRRETIQNPTGETRPNNVALLYCIKN